MIILQTNKLSKSYGSIRAVDHLDLKVEKGQVMGILGPNGSGKTTTLGLILSILKPSSGSYEWFEGTRGSDHRRSIGSILETPNFFPYLNADQNLEIVRRIKGLDKSNFDEELNLVKLIGRRKSKFSTYSLGMKQRLAIAATLIGDPEVVIFDEPTNGLDPEGIAEVRRVLSEIAGRGKTVIMASHILDEVEKICSHVTIIKRGQLLASGPVGSILTNDNTIEVGSTNMEALLNHLTSDPNISIVQKFTNRFECSAHQEYDPQKLTTALANKGIPVTHFVVRKKRLEDEFLEITNQNN